MKNLLSKRDQLVNNLKGIEGSNLYKSIIKEVERLTTEIESMNYKTNDQEIVFVTTTEFSRSFCEMEILNYLHYISSLKNDDILEMLNFLNICKVEAWRDE